VNNAPVDVIGQRTVSLTRQLGSAARLRLLLWKLSCVVYPRTLTPNNLCLPRASYCYGADL
jgi:hypothetical protein